MDENQLEKLLKYLELQTDLLQDIVDRLDNLSQKVDILISYR